jgi:molybdate-binding protein
VISQMLSKLFKKQFLRTVTEYGDKLASEQMINEKETEKCHLAKLHLISESENDIRVNSIKTLHDVNSKVLIPHILREIYLLTKKQPSKRISQMLVDLYSYLCRDKSSLNNTAHS